MIVETSDSRFYRVHDTAEEALAHVWYGLPVKKVKGEFVHTAAATKMLAKCRPFELVRKIGCRVVEA